MYVSHLNVSSRWPSMVWGLLMVSLWDLLLVVCGAMCFGGALAPARIAKVGTGGYSFVIIIGLAVGVCCVWTLQKLGTGLMRYVSRQSASLHERYLGALYFGAMLWIGISTLIGLSASTLALRLIQ